MICKGTTEHKNTKTYIAECIIVPGNYTLKCMAIDHHGWAGGFIEINGKKYCNDFSELETHEDIIISGIILLIS